MSGKRLVIDACVGGASSDKDSMQSKHCSEFLLWVYKKQYHVIVSGDLCSEWKRHDSDYAIKWRKSMREKRRIHKVECPHDDDLRGRVTLSEYLRDKPDVVPIVLEDMHLIELAFKSDNTVVSLDRVRLHFKAISQYVEELKIIVWVNPTNTGEEPIEWLKNGALPDDFRTLGYVAPKKTLYRNGHKIRTVV
jgi:hypothetical protein